MNVTLHPHYKADSESPLWSGICFQFPGSSVRHELLLLQRARDAHFSSLLRLLFLVVHQKVLRYSVFWLLPVKQANWSSGWCAALSPHWNRQAGPAPLQPVKRWVTLCKHLTSKYLRQFWEDIRPEHLSDNEKSGGCESRVSLCLQSMDETHVSFCVSAAAHQLLLTSSFSCRLIHISNGLIVSWFDSIASPGPGNRWRC